MGNPIKKKRFTDKELLDLIWVCQLKNLSHKIVDKYAGVSRKYGLGDISDTNYRYSSEIHSHYRDRITTVIGKSQLLIRIKKLYKNGDLKSSTNNNGYPITFMIMNTVSKNAYKDAHDFWRGKGLPQGFDSVNGCCRTIILKPGEFDSMRAECETLLITKYVKNPF